MLICLPIACCFVHTARAEKRSENRAYLWCPKCKMLNIWFLAGKVCQHLFWNNQMNCDECFIRTPVISYSQRFKTKEQLQQDGTLDIPMHVYSESDCGRASLNPIENGYTGSETVGKEGEICFWLKGQQRLFGELELGLSWEKDQIWVDRKNRVGSSGWGWWSGLTYRGSNSLLGLQTCRDLEGCFWEVMGRRPQTHSGARSQGQMM